MFRNPTARAIRMLVKSILVQPWECNGCEGSVGQPAHSGHASYLAAGRAKRWAGPRQAVLPALLAPLPSLSLAFNFSIYRLEDSKVKQCTTQSFRAGLPRFILPQNKTNTSQPGRAVRVHLEVGGGGGRGDQVLRPPARLDHPGRPVGHSLHSSVPSNCSALCTVTSAVREAARTGPGRHHSPALPRGNTGDSRPQVRTFPSGCKNRNGNL